MALIVETLERSFRYQGITLPDPNPSLSIKQVMALFSGTYPELANAKPITDTKTEGGKTKEVTTFHIAAGTKG